MNKHVIAIVVALGAFLAGCASVPTPEELAKADYGREMTQADCEQAVKKYMSRRLKDPASATYDFEICTRGYASSAPILGQKKAYGYNLNAHINARNGFGGYAGAKTYQFLVRDGAVIRQWQYDSDMGIMLPF